MSANRIFIKWRIVLATNLVSGLLLWFFLITYYSFGNVRLNLLFALVIGLIGAITLLFIFRSKSPEKIFSRSLYCLPSLGGACLYISLYMLVLGSGFFRSVSLDGVVVQRAFSPQDPNHFVELRCVYSRGFRIMSVQYRYNDLPLLKRDLYSYLEAGECPVESDKSYVDYYDGYNGGIALSDNRSVGHEQSLQFGVDSFVSTPFIVFGPGLFLLILLIVCIEVWSLIRKAGNPSLMER
jgi:hypothetical protein